MAFLLEYGAMSSPTQFQPDPEYSRWSSIYQGPNYYYGFDPGPIARRAVRYHQPLSTSTPTALDVGCGEGQDVAYLCENGYQVTGIDFVPDAIEKARRLIEERQLRAQLHHNDLREWNWNGQHDLVLAVNSLQFLGSDAPSVLSRVRDSVAVGGVLGLSLFSSESGSETRSGVFFISLDELLGNFNHQGETRNWQMLETTNLWQWNARANAPQPFVTLIAQRLK